MTKTQRSVERRAALWAVAASAAWAAFCFGIAYLSGEGWLLGVLGTACGAPVPALAALVVFGIEYSKARSEAAAGLKQEGKP